MSDVELLLNLRQLAMDAIGYILDPEIVRQHGMVQVVNEWDDRFDRGADRMAPPVFTSDERAVCSQLNASMQTFADAVEVDTGSDHDLLRLQSYRSLLVAASAAHSEMGLCGRWPEDVPTAREVRLGRYSNA